MKAKVKIADPEKLPQRLTIIYELALKRKEEADAKNNRSKTSPTDDAEPCLNASLD